MFVKKIWSAVKWMVQSLWLALPIWLTMLLTLASMAILWGGTVFVFTLQFSNFIHFVLLFIGPLLFIFAVVYTLTKPQILAKAQKAKIRSKVKIDKLDAYKIVKFASIFMMFGALSSSYVLNRLTSSGEPKEAAEILEIGAVISWMFGGYVAILLYAARLIFHTSLNDKRYTEVLIGLSLGLIFTVGGTLYTMFLAWMEGGFLVYLFRCQTNF